jgi:hypothetical protein
MDLTWWNNIDAVRSFCTLMQTFIVVFGLATAAATALSIIASRRISKLRRADVLGLKKRLESAERTTEQIQRELEESKAERDP